MRHRCCLGICYVCSRCHSTSGSKSSQCLCEECRKSQPVGKAVHNNRHVGNVRSARSCTSQAARDKICYSVGILKSLIRNALQVLGELIYTTHIKNICFCGEGVFLREWKRGRCVQHDNCLNTDVIYTIYKNMKEKLTRIA